MIDATKLDLEGRKDLLYDIRDGRVKDEDVYWGYLRNNTEVKEVISEIKNLETDLTAIQARKIMGKVRDKEYKEILEEIKFFALHEKDNLIIENRDISEYTQEKLEELGYVVEYFGYYSNGDKFIKIKW